MGSAVGTIFVISARVGKSICESRAAKEQHVRQHRMYSITQTHAYTPNKKILQETRNPMTTPRASRIVSFLLGLALGTGVAFLLSLLSAWFSPSTQATTTRGMSDDQVQVWTLSPSEAAALSMSPALIEDPFARL